MDKAFYRELLDQVSDGVYFITRDRHITYWNGGAERITGYSAGDVAGRSCSEGILRHINGDGRQLCLSGCPLVGVMKDGKPREARVYLHHKDGHRVPVTCGARRCGTQPGRSWALSRSSHVERPTLMRGSDGSARATCWTP